MSPTTEYTTLDAARHWLKLGFHILPVQHNKKFLCAGFGLHQAHITTDDEARIHFLDGTKNIAIVATGENFILDFDEFRLYAEWAKTADERYTTSYTEYTPRGAHVWLSGQIIEGLTLRDGIEVKRVVLVSPSVVDGAGYERGHGAIYRGAVDEAFEGLTVPGTPTAYLLRTRQQDQVKPRPQVLHVGAAGPVAQIKDSLNIAEVFSTLSPTRATMRGTGRYITAKCPWHKNGHEVKSSFWLDTQKNLYGCHGCHERGDVINLYARFTGRTVQEAIEALRAEVVR